MHFWKFLSAEKESKSPSRRVAIEHLEQRLQFTALPTGFSESVVAGNIGSPTAMDVLPDGRVLIADQGGTLRVVKNGALLPTPFLTATVTASGERGLLGVTHDPNFNTNHFIYTYHTVPGSSTSAPFNIVTRYTANGDTVLGGSGLNVLMLDNLSSATNHNGGAMHFGKDGLLYIAVGENANPANAQTLSNLLGKVLRIDVSKVTFGDPINNVAKLVPTSNPFVGSTGGTINGAIYALGFRNPFTFGVNPSNGSILINDVGQTKWEEIDKLVAGANYGWNKAEGFATTVPPTGLGPGTYQQPQMAYGHTGGVAGGGIAIVGGAFYYAPAGASNPFPSSYIGQYFYGDLGSNWIRVFDPAKLGTTASTDSSSAFATDASANPVGFEIAPDGGLYYLSRGNGGRLMKISYINGNGGGTGTVAPQVTQGPAKATIPVGGSVTFTVSATGSAPLQYVWQRNNGRAGSYADIAGATGTSYTFSNATAADNGARFRVVVKNNVGTATSAPATLTVSGTTTPPTEPPPPTSGGPVLTVTSGLRNGKFDAGKTITIATTATNPDGTAIPYSKFAYTVDYVTSFNSVSGGVVRPFVGVTKGKNGITFTPAATGPYTETDVLYRVTFAVTDNTGASKKTVLDIKPNVVNLTLATLPSGITLNVDGQPRVAPVTFGSVVGFSRVLDAPLSQSLNGKTWQFVSWSDGLAAAHNVLTPTANATYTATYK